MTTKMLKPAAVAAALDVTVREVQLLCERGDIRAGKVGRHWRIHPDDFEAYVRKVRGLTTPAVVEKMEAAS